MMREKHSLGLLLICAGLCLNAPSHARHRDRMGGAGITMADLHFANEAATGGRMEVELGNLALQRAVDSRVRDFGQRMVDDHSRANDQLKDLAQRQNFSLPARLNGKSRKEEGRLSRLSGSAFDRAFMRAMVKDHEDAVAAFRKEASNGRDPDLSDWAKQTLPTLEDHLRMARDA